MNLYESKGVLDSDLEPLIKEANQKRVESFYAGVDVTPISGLYPFLTPKCTLSYPKNFRRSSVHLGVRKRVKPKMTRVSVLGTDAIIEILE